MRYYLFSIISIIFPITLAYSSDPGVTSTQENLLHCAQRPNDERITLLQDQILSHQPEPLSYKDLLRLISEGSLSKEDAIDLIKYGYGSEVGNPLLFLRSFQEVSDEQYSLNFLWIHKESVQERGHLMGSDEIEFRKQIVYPLKDWQSKQPTSAINVWYDGHLVPGENVTVTKEHLRNSGLDLANISLRDINDIPYVQQNQQLFATNIAIYFRVDLAKAVIADYVLRNDKLLYVVTIDGDVVAVVKSQLFDCPTLKALHEVGYAFGTAGDAIEENSFIMLYNGAQLNTLDIHKTTVIDAAASEAKKRHYKYVLDQDVFDKYTTFKTKMRVQYRNRTDGTWWAQDILVLGKFMIFPRSRFSFTRGYDELQIQKMRKALLDAPEQSKALLVN
jgi:hypothetical protein